MPRVRVAPREECIERGDQKGQAVYSGNRGKLHQSAICRGWIAEQVPRKTDFRQPGAEHLERNPEEGRAEASERDTSPRKTVDRPGGPAVCRGPHRSDQ